MKLMHTFPAARLLLVSAAAALCAQGAVNASSNSKLLNDSVGKAKAVSEPKASAAAALAASAAGAEANKDVVVDSAGTVAVPMPAAASVSPQAATPAPAVAAAPGSNTATATALAELGLNLLRQQSEASGQGQRNAVVSPVSLTSALGMVHAGTVGQGARELSALLGAPSASNKVYSARLPALLKAITAEGSKGSELVSANRVWVDTTVQNAIPVPYAAMVNERFGADGVLVNFAQANAARQGINQWVAKATHDRIKELMPAGSITPTIKVVVTNAIHFKSPWAQPFDRAETRNSEFVLGNGSRKPVPTMHGQRQVRMGVVDNVTVIELPFADARFVLRVAMPPAGHTLHALETDLDGADIMSWGSQLKPTSCRVALPKFNIAPASQPLKEALRALGVSTIFSQQADLSPMLGASAKGVEVDNVYQSASIVVDEEGGEAAAATGASMQVKSFGLSAPSCEVNRPFLFTLVHRATQTPVFVGKVADPTQP
jgi:serpin B